LEETAMLPSIGKFSLLALSLLVGAGGAMGYVKAKSKASLISGLISAALLAAAFGLSFVNAEMGLILGLVVAIALCVVFGIRLKKTGKFMPSGMLLTMCAIESAILLAAVFVH
jgi:uncharacterized membrane protein (UPF0136 family)